MGLVSIKSGEVQNDPKGYFNGARFFVKGDGWFRAGQKVKKVAAL